MEKHKNVWYGIVGAPKNPFEVAAKGHSMPQDKHASIENKGPSPTHPSSSMFTEKQSGVNTVNEVVSPDKVMTEFSPQRRSKMDYKEKEIILLLHLTAETAEPLKGNDYTIEYAIHSIFWFSTMKVNI